MVWPPPISKPSPEKIVVPIGGSYVGEGSGGGKGGTYVGQSGTIISAGRGSIVGSSSSASGYHSGYESVGYTNQPENRTPTSDVYEVQRAKAQIKLGQIRNVILDRSAGTRTFVSMDGRKYTFPINSTSYSASTQGYRNTISKGKIVKESGFFGGIPSRESLIPIKEENRVKVYQPYQVNAEYQKQFEGRVLNTLQSQYDKQNKVKGYFNGDIRDILPNAAKDLVDFELIRQSNKKSFNTLTATEKDGLRSQLTSYNEQIFSDIDKSKNVYEKVWKGVFVAGTIGFLNGVLDFKDAITDIPGFVKNQVSAVWNWKETGKQIGDEFTKNPVGTISRYYSFSKSIGLTGKTILKSPVSQFIKKELFIRTQPKNLQPIIRKILNASNIQKKINPFKLETLSKVDLFEIKSLSKIEAKALSKALVKTKSIVFGSSAARTLSKKLTPIPKDVDLAVTKNIANFKKAFISELPKSMRLNYKLKGQKLVRADGTALFDVKSLERLIPNRSKLTGKGQIPVSGFIWKLITKDKILPKLIKKAYSSAYEVTTEKLVNVKGIKMIGFGEQTLRKALGTLQVLIEKNSRRAKDPQSLLIALEVQKATLKLEKQFKGKIGKALIDRKVNKLDSAIKLLKSKSFAKLLDSKVKGLTKEYPLVSKLDIKKLKKLKLAEIKERVAKQITASKLFKKLMSSKKATANINLDLKETVKKLSAKIIERKIYKFSELPKYLKLFSELPESRLPKIGPKAFFRTFPSSVLPNKMYKMSQLPSILKISKLSQIPSKLSSKLAKSIIPMSRLSSYLGMSSKVPSSKLPQSKLPQSKLMRSVIPMSRLPSYLGIPSRLPQSRMPISKIPKIPTSVLPKIVKTVWPVIPKKRKQNSALVAKIKNFVKAMKEKKKFVYIPDLLSILFGRYATAKQKIALLKIGKIYTGIEARPVI